jgi:hypothetical protein
MSPYGVRSVLSPYGDSHPFHWSLKVSGGRTELQGNATSNCTGSSGIIEDMARKRKPKLDLGPSQVAVNAFRGKGGVHDDQKLKTNHKKARKAAKQALREHDEN